MARYLLMLLVAVPWSHALAQGSSSAEESLPRSIALLAGADTPLGGRGALAEFYVADGRVSMIGGVG
jgi:hypothetical protein